MKLQTPELSAEAQQYIQPSTFTKERSSQGKVVIHYILETPSAVIVETKF